jgi:hypothetical protein
MKMRTVAAVVSVLAVLGASVALAQRGLQWPGSGGWGARSGYGRMYDPKTVATIRGEVVSVDTFIPAKGMSAGVHLTLKTAAETVSVHVGPEWYISGQDTKIAAGDSIEVKGSRITFDTKPAIIAAQITKGEETLRLRDDDGFPLWAGWRRRK